LTLKPLTLKPNFFPEIIFDAAWMVIGFPAAGNMPWK
jgi:hypothetical protein